MRTSTKLVVAAFAALTMLAALTSSAFAGRLRTSEQNFRVDFRPLTFNAAGRTISCPITLTGRFASSTIAKEIVRNQGSITAVNPVTAGEPNPCTGGSITVLTETLPWEVRYASFAGTLPNISRIRLRLVGVRFQINAGGTVCLAGTTAAEPSLGEINLAAGGVAQRLIADETAGIRLGGGFLCSLAGNSFFQGTGTVTNAAGGAITVTLI
jgi:hypothetical protein